MGSLSLPLAFIALIVGLISAVIGLIGKRGETKATAEANLNELHVTADVSLRDDQKEFIDVLREENRKLREEVRDLKSTVDGLRDQVSELRDALYKERRDRREMESRIAAESNERAAGGSGKSIRQAGDAAARAQREEGEDF